jgi:hypothetical protein
MSDLTFVLEQIIKITGKQNITALEKEAREAGIAIDKLTEKIHNYSKATVKANSAAVDYARRIRDARKRRGFDSPEYVSHTRAQLRATDGEGRTVNRGVSRLFRKSSSAEFRFSPDQDLSALKQFLDGKNHELIRAENFGKKEAQLLRERIAEKKYEAAFWKMWRKEQKDEALKQQKFDSWFFEQERKEKVAAQKQFNKDFERLQAEELAIEKKWADKKEHYRVAARKADMVAALEDRDNQIKHAAEHRKQMETIANVVDKVDNRGRMYSQDADYTRRKGEVASLLAGASEDSTQRNIRNSAAAMKEAAEGAKQLRRNVAFGVNDLLHFRHVIYGLGIAGVFYAGTRAVTSFASALTNAYKDSIMFNEEVRRSEITFQNLGTQGTGMAASDIRKLPKNDPRFQTLMQSKEFSKELSAMLLEQSAYTGQEYSAVVAAVATMLPDIIDKLPNKKGGNKLLDNKSMLLGLAKDYIQLGATLQASDPMGHDLKWQLFAIQEMFAGTSGGKKDSGKESVASVRRRLGIKIKDDDALAIAKAVNAGEVRKAMDLIMERFDKAGQSVTKFKDLLASTLMPNVNKAGATLKIFGKDITEGSFNELIYFFTALQMELTEIREDPIFKGIFEDWGKRVRGITENVTNKFADFIDLLQENDGKELKLFGDNFLNGLEYTLKLGKETLILVGKFGEGFGKEFFGNDFKNVKEVLKSMRDSAPAAVSLGESMAKFSKAIIDMAPSIINILSYLAEHPALVTAMMGAAAGSSFGPIGAGVGFVTGAGAGAAMFPNSKDNSPAQILKEIEFTKNNPYIASPEMIKLRTFDGKRNDIKERENSNKVGAIINHHGNITVVANNPKEFISKYQTIIGA